MRSQVGYPHSQRSCTLRPGTCPSEGETREVRTTNGGWRTTNGGCRTTNGGWRTTDSGHRTSDGDWRTTHAGCRTADSIGRTTDSGWRQPTAAGGQRTAVAGQPTAVGGLRTRLPAPQVRLGARPTAPHPPPLLRDCLMKAVGVEGRRCVASQMRRQGEAGGAGRREQPSNQQSVRRRRRGGGASVPRRGGSGSPLVVVACPRRGPGPAAAIRLPRVLPVPSVACTPVLACAWGTLLGPGADSMDPCAAAHRVRWSGQKDDRV